MKRLIVLALLSGGCLPLPDNQYTGNIVTSDMSSDGGGDMMTGPACTGASSKRVNSVFFTMEEGEFARGITLRLEGCEGAAGSPGVSMPSTADGAVVPIPESYVDKVSRYLIAEGNYTTNVSQRTGTIHKTWIAPRVAMDGGIRTTDTISHIFINSMDNVRAAIAKELAAAGKIPTEFGASGEKFSENFTFAYGATVMIYPGAGDSNIRGATWSITTDGLENTDADKASCDPKTTCCVYYANIFDQVFPRGPSKPKTNLLELAATSSPGGFFAVVCPGKSTDPEKPEITLTQKSAMLFDKNSSPVPGSTFSSMVLPRKRNDAVSIEYFVIQ